MDNDKQFLIIILVVISLLALFVTLPVLEYVLLSIILAYVLFPLHVRLREYVGSSISAIFLIGAAIVAILGPIAYILWVFFQDLIAIVEGDTDLEIEFLENRIEEVIGIQVDLEAQLTQLAENFVSILFGGVTGFLTTALQVFIGIALVLFLVFYLLRDGEEFVAWVESLSPLPIDDTKHLFQKVHQTMWGAVIGHTFAALVQALVAGFGFWLVGIDSVVFWTVVMAILAFLPLIGAFLVWAPASVYLVATDQVVPGLFLFVYGITIVSMIDYYARPLVIDQQARLNPGVILVGVFGGIFTFGFVGLFIGPIIIGVLAATLQTIKEKGISEELRQEIRENRDDEQIEEGPAGEQQQLDSDGVRPPDGSDAASE